MSTAQKTAQPPAAKTPQPAAEKSQPTAPSVAGQRIVSLDQFRGYTVAGMFVVNFLGAYKEWVPPVLLHHHNYCSYADTIMPHFLFAVGFAFRLTFGRRVQTQGLAAANWRMVRRLLGLMLVAMVIYTMGRVADSWEALLDKGFWGVFEEPLKREWMQTLGHIAVTSLWILPVIRYGAGVRVTYMVVSALAHVGLSYWFNYTWTNSSPNGIDGGPLGFLTWTVPAMVGTLVCDAIAGSSGKASGWTLTKLVGWSMVLMVLGYAFSCGTRMYDLTPEQLAALKQQRDTQGAEVKAINDETAALNKELEARHKEIDEAEKAVEAAKRDELRAKVDEMKKTSDVHPLFAHFVVDKAAREYRKEEPSAQVKELQAKVDALKNAPELATLKDQIRQNAAKLREYTDVKLAPDPVVPSAERWTAFKERVTADWTAGVTAPPFVMPPQDDPRIDPPPHDDHFLWNYWMMTQRGGSLSYLTFTAGFSILVYVLFYVACDLWGWQLGLFRTFGTNALAGYVLHSMIGGAVKQFIPGGAPWWYSFGGFLLFFWLVYLFVRTLEKNRIYLKL